MCAVLGGAEEWLYEQSDDSAKIFKDKLAELKTLAEPIFFRLSELSGMLHTYTACGSLLRRKCDTASKHAMLS